MAAPTTPLATALLERLDRPGLAPSLRALALLHGAAGIGRFDAVELLVPAACARGATEARLEEAALLVVPYAGFPRAIETLGLLARERAGAPATTPATTLEDSRDRARLRRDGRIAFERVYGESADDVLAHLDRLVPGFGHLVLEWAYGRIIHRGALSAGERELLGVAALALMALPAPLGSHVRGALRNGFAAPAVEDILQTCSVLADERAEAAIGQALDRLSRKVFHP